MFSRTRRYHRLLAELNKGMKSYPLSRSEEALCWQVLLLGFAIACLPFLAALVLIVTGLPGTVDGFATPALAIGLLIMIPSGFAYETSWAMRNGRG